MKVYELCSKLASGEWNKARDEQGYTYMLDDEKGLIYRKNKYWLKCTMLPADEGDFVKDEIDYPLTWHEAIRRVHLYGGRAERSDGGATITKDAAYLIEEDDMKLMWRII